MNSSKIKLFKNFLATLLIILFPIQSLASDGIFFNLSSSRKLAGDFDYLKKNKADNEMIINVLDEENKQYFNLSKEFVNKIILLEEDKQIYKVRGDKFETEYLSTSKSLIKCKDETPSRITWYMSGFVSAIIVAVVGLVSIK